MTFYSVTPAQDSNLEKEARKEEERRLFVPLGKLRLLTAENRPFYTRPRKEKLEMSWWERKWLGVQRPWCGCVFTTARALQLWHQPTGVV